MQGMLLHFRDFDVFHYVYLANLKDSYREMVAVLYKVASCLEQNAASNLLLLSKGTIDATQSKATVWFGWYYQVVEQSRGELLSKLVSSDSLRVPLY